MASEEKSQVTGVSLLRLDDGRINVYLPQSVTALTYRKFKVTPSGFLLGYWNSDGHTKSGFYRDTLIYIGDDYVNAEITQLDKWNLVIKPKEQQDGK